MLKRLSLYVLAVILSIAWTGYVMSVLWGWFIVPLGVIPITVWHAIGISSLIRVFTAKRSSLTKPDKALKQTNDPGEFTVKEVLEDFFFIIYLSTFLLFIGSIANLNMGP